MIPDSRIPSRVGGKIPRKSSPRGEDFQGGGEISCTTKSSPPGKFPRFPRKFSPRGEYFLGKFIPRGRKFPRKIHPPGVNFQGGGKFPRQSSPPWYIIHCLASLGGTTLVLSANQVAWHKIHLVTRQKSAVGSREVGYVMFWLIFLEGTSLG